MTWAPGLHPFPGPPVPEALRSLATTAKDHVVPSLAVPNSANATASSSPLPPLSTAQVFPLGPHPRHSFKLYVRATDVYEVSHEVNLVDCSSFTK